MIIDQIRGVQDHANQLDWYLRRQITRDLIEPSGDRTASKPIHDFDLGITSRILFGRVVDALPYPKWYKVQPEGLLPSIPCQLLSPTGLGPVGPRSLNQLTPDCRVFFVLHPSRNEGAIIGVLPNEIYDGRTALGDFWSLQSRILVDEANKAPMEFPGGGDITDWSSGRPLDSHGAGEAGWIAETGVAIASDSFMAMLRANENCGVWAFSGDDLLRLAGHNLQFRTMAELAEYLDDEGEASIIKCRSPYFWELLGAWKHAQKIYRTYTPQESQIDKPEYQILEPLHDDQQPIPRIQEFGGYLGQGGLRMVSGLPILAEPGPADPPGTEPEAPNRYSIERIMPGLFEEHVALTGAYRVASAKGITFTKRITNPVPKQLRRPEDPQGDNSENYLAAGQQGSGPAHNITGDIINTDDTAPGMLAACATPDRHSYGFGWEVRHPFRLHTRDWYCPDDNQMGVVGSQTQAPFDFTTLRAKTFIPAPDGIDVTIDHRYGTTKVFPNTSCVELLEDGTVVIEDGFGSAIRMHGGNIYLSCPGDVVMQPGRSVINLAGYDFIVRAHNAADISTTKGDMRLRAGADLKIKGTNTEVYATESVTIKSDGTASLLSGDDVYIRSGAPDSLGVIQIGTGIYLDAGQGDGIVSSISSTFERFLSSAAFDFFQDAEGVTLAANSYSADGAVLGGSLMVDGCGVFNGSLFAQDWLVALSGHVATGAADAYGNLVSTLAGSSLTNAEVVMDAAALAQTTNIASGDQSYDDNYVTCLYAEGAGDNEVIQDKEFLFRSAAEYGTTEFKLYETRWQQLARLTGQGLGGWVELDEAETYPYPGMEQTIDGTAFRRVDLTLFDAEAGVAKPTSDAIYQAPAFAEPDDVVLDGNYLVIDAAAV